MSSSISAWSLSRLDVYETCPYRAYLQYVERVPISPRVAPDGLDEHPLDRGIRIHGAAERFICENINLIPELQPLATELEAVREYYRQAPGQCVIEQEWAITDQWQPTGWLSPNAWGRMKLDIGVIEGTHMRVIDLKTGKKYPVKHLQQGQLYGLCAALRFPQVKSFSVEFWYCDVPEIFKKEYSRTMLEVFQDDFDRRAHTMTAATEFLPRPSGYACRFCPYGEGHDGNKHCEFRFSYEN